MKRLGRDEYVDLTREVCARLDVDPAQVQSITLEPTGARVELGFESIHLPPPPCVCRQREVLDATA